MENSIVVGVGPASAQHVISKRVICATNTAARRLRLTTVLISIVSASAFVKMSSLCGSRKSGCACASELCGLQYYLFGSSDKNCTFRSKFPLTKPLALLLFIQFPQWEKDPKQTINKELCMHDCLLHARSLEEPMCERGVYIATIKMDTSEGTMIALNRQKIAYSSHK